MERVDPDFTPEEYAALELGALPRGAELVRIRRELVDIHRSLGLGTGKVEWLLVFAELEET